MSTSLLQELTSYRFIVTLDAGDAYLPPARRACSHCLPRPGSRR